MSFAIGFLRRVIARTLPNFIGISWDESRILGRFSYVPDWRKTFFRPGLSAEAELTLLQLLEPLFKLLLLNVQRPEGR